MPNIDQTNRDLPPAQGLYHPRNEHDACGLELREHETQLGFGRVRRTTGRLGRELGRDIGLDFSATPGPVEF